MSSLLAALNGVLNASQPLPTLVTSGQPEPQHLQALKEAGAKTVLDIRDPMETRSFDEPELVRSLGMAYVNVSVRHGALDDALMETVLGVVRRNALRPMLRSE